MVWSAAFTPVLYDEVSRPPRRAARFVFVEPDDGALAWPRSAVYLPALIDAGAPPRRDPRRRKSPLAFLDTPETGRGRFFGNARGLYRVFNAAIYRFYRSNSAPPEEDDSPFATSATLPHTPADTYADGTWYLSVSYFNGVLDSGFLPLGDSDETYLRLDLASGAEIGSPPNAPLDWRLELRAGGVVRVHAIYWQTNALRATEWSIGYTTDGSTPAADTPTVTVTMPDSGLAVLSYDLPAQSHGTTVKVRLQTRYLDGASYRYSEGSTVKTATADAQGPDAPEYAESWPGYLPEDL